jgi:hypothetical protein
MNYISKSDTRPMNMSLHTKIRFRDNHDEKLGHQKTILEAYENRINFELQLPPFRYTLAINIAHVTILLLPFQPLVSFLIGVA